MIQVENTGRLFSTPMAVLSEKFRKDGDIVKAGDIVLKLMISFTVRTQHC